MILAVVDPRGHPHKINTGAESEFTASPYPAVFFLMHLPSLMLWRQIRIIRCIQSSGTLVHTHRLVSCFLLYLVCIAVSLQLVVSSAALSAAKN